MNVAEKSKLQSSAADGGGKEGATNERRRFSAQALARMGRRAVWPEARVLAERFEVSYSHALRVCQGKRKSPLGEFVEGIRAELRARGVVVGGGAE